MKTLSLPEKVNQIIAGKYHSEIGLGYCRYEALRKLTARQFSELCERNLRGENFDSMVDELMKKL